MKRLFSTTIMFILLINCIYSQKFYKSENAIRDIDNYSIYANLSSNKSATDSLYYIRYNG